MTTEEPFSSGETGLKFTSGDTFLKHAQDILAVQLVQLRELVANVSRQTEEFNQERRNLNVDLEEVNYRLRYITEKNDPSLDAGTQSKRHETFLETKAILEERKLYLDKLLVELEDAQKRLKLLIRQSEIASNQLTRSQTTDSSEESSNAWEVALRAQLIEGQEEERKRLAREIHDGPAQVLANAAMQLDFVGQLLQKDRPNAMSELTLLRGVMRESLGEVRRFMFNLQPKMLVEHGLVPTLQHYCADFANQYNLKIDINLPDLTGLLTPNQELATFRVIQEALQNVQKHANATEVVISCSREPDGKILVSITDNGRGFDPEAIEKRGTGLVGMHERAELIGGKLKINSRPGYRTEIRLII